MWPKSYFSDCITISTASWESSVANALISANGNITSFTSAAFGGSANEMRLFPFSVQNTFVPQTGWVMNGATATGNIMMGIYTNDGSTKANNIWNSGSTAQAGTNAIQSWAISNVELGPGNYYFAFLASSTTTTFFQWGLSNYLSGSGFMGAATNSPGSTSMPSSITLGASARSPILMGITARSVA